SPTATATRPSTRTRTTTATSATDRAARPTRRTPGSEGAARRPRIAAMGGTFDPVHNGHLVAASAAQHTVDLDAVVCVPPGEPWMKADVTEAEHRYLMTVVATASNPRFTVSRVDIDRDGPTYTIDTLRDLRAQRPDAELFFITGADAV